MELAYCEKCISMTNNDINGCMRCRSLTGGVICDNIIYTTAGDFDYTVTVVDYDKRLGQS